MGHEKVKNQVEILDARAFCQLICLQSQVQIADKFVQQPELSRKAAAKKNIPFVLIPCTFFFLSFS